MVNKIVRTDNLIYIFYYTNDDFETQNNLQLTRSLYIK